MLPESWTLLRRTATECVVQRNLDGRQTIWTLQDRGADWRIYAIRFSRANKGTDGTLVRTKTYAGSCKTGLGLCNANAHPNGIRLSDNRIDQILRDYCEGRRV